MRRHWSMIRVEAADLSANTRCLAKAAYSLEANLRVSGCLSNPLTYSLPGQMPIAGILWSQVYIWVPPSSHWLKSWNVIHRLRHVAANRFQCAGSIRGSEAVKNDGFASLRALADLQKIKLLYGL